MRKLAEIRAARGYQYRIEVDGGVGMDTVAQVVQAGAEILVAGNAVFGKGDAKECAGAAGSGAEREFAAGVGEIVEVRVI
jgi:ribulose-phosphate 3-epimerase